MRVFGALNASGRTIGAVLKRAAAPALGGVTTTRAYGFGLVVAVAAFNARCAESRARLPRPCECCRAPSSMRLRGIWRAASARCLATAAAVFDAPPSGMACDLFLRRLGEAMSDSHVLEAGHSGSPPYRSFFLPCLTLREGLRVPSTAAFSFAAVASVRSLVCDVIEDVGMRAAQAARAGRLLESFTRSTVIDRGSHLTACINDDDLLFYILSVCENCDCLSSWSGAQPLLSCHLLRGWPSRFGGCRTVRNAAHLTILAPSRPHFRGGCVGGFWGGGGLGGGGGVFVGGFGF